jgi:hypothetical protein
MQQAGEQVVDTQIESYRCSDVVGLSAMNNATGIEEDKA